jgi:hypothetical protein
MSVLEKEMFSSKKVAFNLEKETFSLLKITFDSEKKRLNFEK